MPIRADLEAAETQAWTAIGAPGTWWTGPERVAIAAETREAIACPLCATRHGTSSPTIVAGDHRTLGVLPAAAMEVIHRIRTDSGRLSQHWYWSVLAGGLSEEQYVELLAITAIVVAVDTVRAAVGLPLMELPVARGGEPSRLRPRGARRDVAWVATLAP